MDGPPARLALLARTAGNIVCEHIPRDDVLLHRPYGVIGNTVAERTTVARSALHPWQPASSPASLALRRGTLHCASCWHPRSATEAEPPVQRAATFTLPGVVRTTVARSALHRWEPDNPHPPLGLLHSALRPGSCWCVNPNTEAGQLAQRAAPTRCLQAPTRCYAHKTGGEELAGLAGPSRPH